MFLEPTK